MKRRTFLTASLSGAGLLVLSACTSPEPVPTTTTTPTTSRLPKPTGFERTAWSKDPFSRGAQSYLAVGSSSQDRETLAQPVDDRLFFAGEAVSADRPGTVSGAQESGLRAAEEVAGRAGADDRIAVIGAGIAGATAARQLAAAGFSVVVLEGRDRIGGRIDSVSGDPWPFPVERGAAFVEDVAGSWIIGQLTALSIKSKLFDGNSENRNSAGKSVKATGSPKKTVEEAVEFAQTQPTDVSLADALAHTGAATVPTASTDDITDADWLDEYLAANVASVTGASPDELSAQHGVPSEPPGARRIVLGGYEKVVHSALTNIDVRLSAVITNISYSGDVVGLRFASGESLQADRVVLTVPLGVLKSDAISFDPKLPDATASAISALGMGHNEKVILAFDQAFWQTDAEMWHVVGSDLPITQWMNLEPATGDPVLVGTVAGEQAEKFADLDDDQVRKAALDSLAPFVTSS